MKSIKTLFLILGIVLVQPVLGQEDPASLPTILPPSPNVATLTRFGDVPVSTYTGIPSISVPLFQITSGELSLPISIDYHAGGVRMADDAGTVGLNWAVNAGGAISRSIRGKDDLTSYESTLVPEFTFLAINNVDVMGPSEWGWTNTITEVPGGENRSISLSNVMDNPTEFEWSADLFSYNIMGNAGKFILNRQGEIVFEKQTDVQIEYVNNGYLLTDTKGIKYYFDVVETGDAGPMSGVPTSWQISKIVSPLGDEIQFYYSAFTFYGEPQRNDMYLGGIESCGTPGQNLTEVANVHYTQILDSILYDNGKVIFEYDNERLDYSNGLGRKLISVSSFMGNEESLINKFVFGYGYFNGDEDYSYKRLRLDYIQQVHSGKSLPPYQFKYKETAQNSWSIRTSKGTMSVDHWGFFNNASNTVLYKSFSGNVRKYSTLGIYVDEYYQTIPGADRDVDSVYADIFSLTEISYPTGGKTVFDMESNDFDYERSGFEYLTGAEYEVVQKNPSYTISEGGVSNRTFDLSKMQGGNVIVSITFRCNSGDNCSLSGNEAFVSIFGEQILASELECIGPVCLFTKTYSGINQDQYQVSVTNSSSILADITVKLTFDELKTDNYVDNKNYFSGGGLRVRSITNYDENGERVGRKEYRYHYEEDRDNDGQFETYSFGKLMSPPQYTRYQYVELPLNEASVPCPQFVIFGSSVTGISSSAQGNSVGYDQVIEFSVDQVGNENGKTVFYYHNESDIVPNYMYPGHSIPDLSEESGGFNVRKPGLTNQSDNRNGSLLSTEVYSGNTLDGYSLLQKTENSYVSHDLTQYYNMDFEQVNYKSSIGFIPVRYFISYHYPIHQIRTFQLESTTTTSYENGQSSLITQSYKYESPDHFQQTEVREVLGSGEVRITNIKYPTESIADLPSYASQAKAVLVNKNMIATVLETTQHTEIDGQITTKTSTRNNFKVANATAPVLADVQLSIDSNPLEKRIEYDLYDSEGKPLTVSKTNDHKISYIWGNENELPIAEVINAEESEIFYTSFESDGTPGESATGVKYFAGGYYNIPTAERPTGSNLIVTYWYYDGEWKFNPASPFNGSSVLHSGANRLDEIRIYPADAQMQTLTHKVGIGPSSVTDINNIRMFYEYDEFNRLVKVRDDDGNVIEQHEYSYLDQISTDVSNLDYAVYGGIQTVEIESNREWSISIPAEASWLTVSKNNGIGNDEILITADQSNTEIPRNSSVTITTDGGEQSIINVSQAAASLEIPSSVTIGQTGGSVSFQISSNVPWSFDSFPYWINSSSVSPSSGSGVTTVTMTANANNGSQVLNDNLSVVTAEGLTKTIPVTQDALASFLTVAPSNVIIENESDIKTVNVNTNTAWTTNVNYITGFGWLRVTPYSNYFVLDVGRIPPGAGGFYEAIVEVTGGGITRSVYVTFELGLGGL